MLDFIIYRIVCRNLISHEIILNVWFQLKSLTQNLECLKQQIMSCSLTLKTKWLLVQPLQLPDIILCNYVFTKAVFGWGETCLPAVFIGLV